MKLTLTPSMVTTRKEQRRKNVWAAVFIGMLVVMISQGLAILPSSYIQNNGAKEVYILFANIFVIAAILLFCRMFEHRSPASLGFHFKSMFKSAGIGLTMGTIFLLAIFLINLCTGGIHVVSNLATVSWLYVLLAFLGYLVQGLMEEVVCRGFIMNTLSAKYNVGVGILMNSLIFAVLHAGNLSVTPLALFNLFLAGVFLSFIFYLSDSIFLVGAFHAVWNFMLGPVFGVPVSGSAAYSSLLQTTLLPDKALFNGGTFGFEGGLGLTISAIIGLLVLFLIKRAEDKKQKEVLFSK